MKTAILSFVLLMVVQPAFSQVVSPSLADSPREELNPYRNRPGQPETVQPAQPKTERDAEEVEHVTPGEVDYAKPPRQPLPKWDLKTPSGKAALREYENNMKKMDAIWKSQIEKLKDAYAAKHNAQLNDLHNALMKAMKTEAQAGNLEEALKLKNAANEVVNGDGKKKEAADKKKTNGNGRVVNNEPHIVAVWSHMGKIIQLYSNGAVSSGAGHTWALRGNRLILRTPSPQAPGGAWVDSLIISPDGKTYAGTNNNGKYITGQLISGSMNPPAKEEK